jgi:hypothetical protein
MKEITVTFKSTDRNVRENAIKASGFSPADVIATYFKDAKFVYGVANAEHEYTIRVVANDTNVDVETCKYCGAVQPKSDMIIAHIYGRQAGDFYFCNGEHVAYAQNSAEG